MSGRRLVDLRSVSLALAVVLFGASTGLVAVGYRATQEWQINTLLQVERRVDLMLAFMANALNHDMKGAQVSELAPIELEDLRTNPPFDLRDRFTRAFTRFPYPESFFTWTAAGQGKAERACVFDRFVARSPPAASGPEGEAVPGPIVMRCTPREDVGDLPALARSKALEMHKRFAVFQATRDSTPYQVVVQLFRDDRAPQGLAGLAGFAVNLHWIRERYFQDLMREVKGLVGDREVIAREIGGRQAIGLEILDETGRRVASTGAIAEDGPVRERRFPFLFFDPAMRSSLASDLPTTPEWTVRVGVTRPSPLTTVRRSARRTLLLLALAASASILGLLITARAVRQRAELAAMRSEFISTVTHELKSPLALIRLVGDTIALKRYTSTATIEEYARILSQEANRLARLIDNLLTYARAGDVQGSYSFEPLEAADLVDEALQRFRPRLDEGGFRVEVALPEDLPHLRADRVALMQVLDNVIDNAIKYSGDGRALAIRGLAENGSVRLEVADRGPGIPPEELPSVFDKFYRGRGTRAQGSGLGLAIVRRIVSDHGGRVEIESRTEEGTRVALLLPAVPA